MRGAYCRERGSGAWQWSVEVEVHDERGVLLVDERMVLRRADGLLVPATSDANGIARFNRIPEGKVEVGFASAAHFAEPLVSERDGSPVAASTADPANPSPFTTPLAPPKAKLPTETPDPTATARDEGSDKPALDGSVVARGKAKV